MTQLLSIEWMKVRRYRAFWIVASIFLLFPVADYIISKGYLFPKSEFVFDLTPTFYQIWYNSCYYSGHFLIFISLLLAMLVSNEYQFKTNRQNIIDGWSRSQFFHAKWGLLLSLALATTLFTFVAGLLQGALRGADFAFVGNGISNLGWFFVECLNYYGFGLLIGLLLRRAGLSIIILTAVYFIIDGLIHVYFVRNDKMGILQVDYFLPFESSDQLFPLPGLSSSFEKVSDLGGMPRLPRYTYGIASLCWVAAYYIIGRIRLLRSDW